MSLTSPDFESGAYTNFATPAAKNEGEDNKSSASGIATGARMSDRILSCEFACLSSLPTASCSCLTLSQTVSCEIPGCLLSSLTTNPELKEAPWRNFKISAPW